MLFLFFYFLEFCLLYLIIYIPYINKYHPNERIHHFPQSVLNIFAQSTNYEGEVHVIRLVAIHFVLSVHALQLHDFYLSLLGDL